MKDQIVSASRDPQTSYVFGMVGAGVIIVLILMYWGLGKAHTSERTFHSNSENIQFTVPFGWQPIATQDLPPLTPGFHPTNLAYKKGKCVMVFVDTSDRTYKNNIKQMSFADRVYSEYSQYDGNWYIASTTEARHYTFSGDARQYLPGEFRLSYNVRNADLLLTTSNGSPVPDECNTDMNELLQTITPYFEPVTLTTTSNGTLTPSKVWDDVGEMRDKNSYEHLVFTEDGSDETREVMRLPSIGMWHHRFFIEGNTIYAENGGSIFSINPVTKEAKEVPGAHATGISSLYVHDGMIYYLASTTATFGRCMDYYKLCGADLYSIPVRGGTPTFLAKSDYGKELLGYVPAENAFYILDGWGDGGCSAHYVSKIVNGTEEKILGHSGCWNEETAATYNEMNEAMYRIRTKAEADKFISVGLRVANGRLVPTVGSKAGGSFYFDK